MRGYLSVAIAFCLALLSSVSAANATYIVNTGTTGGGTPWSLYDSQWLAAEFTIAQSETVNSVEAYLWGNTNSGTATAAIYTDGGDVPGSMLYSSQFSTGASNAWYGARGLNWNLAAGTYWAAFEVLPGNTYYGSLPGSAVTPLANEAGYHPGSGWYGYDYLDLGVRIAGTASQGSPVPEPGTITLLGLGMAGLAIYCRNRKNNKA